MSSGRRPTGAASPSAWRSMSMSRKRAPASVSLVFAEPEQGAPLESAATKLPPGVYANDNHMMRKRERLNSNSTLRDDRKDSESISGGSIRHYTTGSAESQPNASMDSLQSTQPEQYTQQATMSAPDVLKTAQWEGYSVESPLASMPQKASSTAALDAPEATLQVPFPIDDANKSKSTPNPSPKSSSWFGSIGRSKGKERVVPSAVGKVVSLNAEVGENASSNGKTSPSEPQHVTSPIEAPPTTINSELEQPAPESQRSPPLQIPANRQNNRGWFSSSSSVPTQPRAPNSPTSPTTPFSAVPHSHNNSVTSMSSLDEEVPRLSVMTPPNTPHPPSVMHQNAASSDVKLSSLNPTTSRFTLSIPLLGRPKVPLDQVVASVVAGGEAKVKKDKELVKMDLSADEQTVSGAEVSRPPIAVEQPPQIPPTSSSDTAPQSTTTERQSRTTVKTVDGQTRDASPASWWGYIGWNGDSNNSLINEPPSDQPTSPSSLSASDSPTVRAVKSAPQLATAAQAFQSPYQESNAESVDDTSLASANQQHMLSPTKKAPSVFSAGTVHSQNSSTWYTPWTWYGNTAANIAGETGKKDGVAEDGTGVLTQSEMVKEEALARGRETAINETVGPTPTIEISAPAMSPASQEPANPIESAISANKSGWAAFFSSKSLGVKTITDGEKKDENGMEVMDIDEDDDDKPDPQINPSTLVVASAGSKAKDTGKPAPETPAPNIPKIPASEPKSSESSDTKGKKSKPPALPLTNSDSIKRDTAKAATKRKASPAPSSKSGVKTPASPRTPNLVLPTWSDTFHAPPRSLLPSPPSSAISKTFHYVSGVLFQKEKDMRKKGKSKAKEKEHEFSHFGKELPRAFDVVEDKLEPDILRGCSKAVIIGVHGWFPGAVMRTVLGDPTGTSGKFVDMMLQALDEFQEKHNVKLKKITKIPLEGEGTINKRVDKLYQNLLANKGWMNDLYAADVIFVATHSQGSVVSTHLLDRLIRDGHIRTSRSMGATSPIESVASGSAEIVPAMQPQRICCLALCGIHLGPLRYLSTSSLLQPYFQYFESAAARELFEFQSTESEVSKQYVNALKNVVHHGTKMVYVASLNDQVVPMYSGLFTTASHPLILRALYVDGDAYQSSDFLSNLLILLLRIMNSGISDSGLLAHLSEVTAGSLNGVGHSTAYEELATYSLAVDYCFLANDGLEAHPELVVEHFDAKSEQNDYEIPWSLRDIIADERVAHFFSNEIVELRDAFRDWHPKTSILRDVKKKLQPIQRLPSYIIQGSTSSFSKL